MIPTGRRRAGARHHDLAKHAGFHVIQQVTVICPATERVRRHEITQAMRRLHADREAVVDGDLRLTVINFDKLSPLPSIGPPTVCRSA